MLAVRIPLRIRDHLIKVRSYTTFMRLADQSIGLTIEVVLVMSVAGCRSLEFQAQSEARRSNAPPAQAALIAKTEPELATAESPSPPVCPIDEPAAADSRLSINRRPVLIVEDPIHDLGTVWVGPVLEHTFRIRNDGADVVWVKRVISAALLEPRCSFSMAPGETVEMPIAIDTKKVHGRFERAVTLYVTRSPDLTASEIEAAEYCIRRIASFNRP